jgi:cell wall-associated NlpC family hydrolase
MGDGSMCHYCRSYKCVCPEIMPARLYSDLIGKAFAPSGRGPLSFDCYGVVKCVLERNGIPAPDYPSADDAGTNAALILAAMEAGWEQVRVPEANCVVLFRMDQRAGTHVAVMVDGAKFLHALEKTGVCVEDVRSELWKRRVLGYYRWGK